MSEHSETLSLPPLEKSKNTYLRPFPKGTVITRVEREGPAHNGPFRGAIDFAMQLGTPVLAPLEGEVKRIVDVHERYGPTEEFVDDLNHITIKHSNGEFSEIGHLAKGSARVKKGDRVKAGQKIAETGNSGWMTEPHLHFLVFRREDNEHGFVGLEPQFKQDILTRLHLKRL